MTVYFGVNISLMHQLDFPHYATSLWLFGWLTVFSSTSAREISRCGYRPPDRAQVSIELSLTVAFLSVLYHMRFSYSGQSCGEQSYEVTNAVGGCLYLMFPHKGILIIVLSVDSSTSLVRAGAFSEEKKCEFRMEQLTNFHFLR